MGAQNLGDIMYENSGDTSICLRMSVLIGGPDSFSHFYIQIAGMSESGILCRFPLRRTTYATLALYYYDFILTFAAEVSYIWPQPISVNTVLFFCNRYISFFGNIVAGILLSTHLSNNNSPE